MKRSVLMKLTACCMTGALVLGSTGVVTMASGLDSALAGMGAEIADSQQQKEVVKVAPTGYDTVAIAQVDEYVNGVYGRSNTFYLTEGEIHNLNDDILLYPGSSTTVEADTFVAYEGAVGKINFIGNIVLD